MKLTELEIEEGFVVDKVATEGEDYWDGFYARS